MQLHWCGSSRFHHWYDKERTIPREILARTIDAQLIGEVGWFELGTDNNRINVDCAGASTSGDTLLPLLYHKPKRGDIFRIAAGGEKPFSWHMTLGLFPFDKKSAEVQGYNIFNLWFDTEVLHKSKGSDQLAHLFQRVHNADNTEFAFIHPYQRWSELTDDLDGEYKDPLTLGPMFRGVLWVIFLAGKHLDFFDREQLKTLDAYQLQWQGDFSLFLRVCKDVNKACDAESELEMFRLTNAFRERLG